MESSADNLGNPDSKTFIEKVLGMFRPRGRKGISFAPKEDAVGSAKVIDKFKQGIQAPGERIDLDKFNVNNINAGRPQSVKDEDEIAALTEQLIGTMGEKTNSAPPVDDTATPQPNGSL